MRIDAETAHAACEAKDRRFDGRFFIGVTSTGIYCRCVCSARTPMRKNRRFFPSAAAAEAEGFRPCLICRPEAAPGLAPIDAASRLAAAALDCIEGGDLEELGIEAIAQRLGVTARHLRRVVQQEFGASPVQLAQTQRLLAAKRLLRETSLPLTEVAFSAGFASVRRFNALFQERYGLNPSTIRRSAKPQPCGLRVELTARGLWRPETSFAFLAERALGGVERVEGLSYVRTLTIRGGAGVLRAEATAKGIALSLDEALQPHLRKAVALTRRVFDLDADIDAIDAALAAEPGLVRAGGEWAGVRLVGGYDPWEILVRAVLGQQVSQKAGRTFTDRLVQRFGAPLPGGAREGLSLLFPGPEVLAEAGVAGLSGLGLTTRRAASLHALSVAIATGAARLDPPESLLSVPGIGPWTVAYLALRSGEPDAWLSGDKALANAYGQGLESAHAAWRPWRSYAVMRLWREGAKAR